MSADIEPAGLGPHPLRVQRPGGWQLALLVARNVEPGLGTGVGVGQGGAAHGHAAGRRLSAREFARRADTSPKRVLAFLEAWNRAAEAGLVPYARDLEPGVPVALPDNAVIPFYGQAGFYRCYQALRLDLTRGPDPEAPR